MPLDEFLAINGRLRQLSMDILEDTFTSTPRKSKLVKKKFWRGEEGYSIF